MGMRNPIPTYSYIISQLVKDHSELAYIHMIQPGIESAGEGVPQALDDGVEVTACYLQDSMISFLTELAQTSRPTILHTNCGLPGLT